MAGYDLVRVNEIECRATHISDIAEMIWDAEGALTIVAIEAEAQIVPPSKGNPESDVKAKPQITPSSKGNANRMHEKYMDDLISHRVTT